MVSIDDVHGGGRIKTRGGQTVDVLTVRYWNETLIVGHIEYPTIISIDEVQKVID